MWKKFWLLFNRPHNHLELDIHLYHFTHLRINLSSILKDRSILSFQRLTEQYGYEKAITFMHDLKRYDFYTSGKKYVNCVIGRAPANYLYRLSGKNWKNEWIAFEIDTKLLHWKTFIIAPSGAASLDATCIHVHPENWKKDIQVCFQKTIQNIERPVVEFDYAKERKFPNDVPTHPNCELLIPNEIESTYWKKVITYDYAVRQTVRILFEKCGWKEFPIQVNKEIFRFHPIKLAKEVV
ncbi:MAG: DUF4433 domain-containing protein [bacterium]|nr:DUF4433 domain-containing protein [bacterium]